LGVFEFRVCNIDNDPTKDATQKCLDLNVLQITNDSTQYPIKSSFTTVHVNVTLPAELLCKHCVFQWKYITGNSWGVSNGKACLGCGKQNEEFYGCSDIAIVNSTTILESTTTTDEETTTIGNTNIPEEITTTTPRNCTSSNIFSQSFDISAIVEQYCQTVCPNKCPLDKIDGNEIFYNGCVNTCNKLCVCQ
jgi:hypothetical protein